MSSLLYSTGKDQNLNLSFSPKWKYHDNHYFKSVQVPSVFGIFDSFGIFWKRKAVGTITCHNCAWKRGNCEIWKFKELKWENFSLIIIYNINLHNIFSLHLFEKKKQDIVAMEILDRTMWKSWGENYTEGTWTIFKKR